MRALLLTVTLGLTACGNSFKAEGLDLPLDSIVTSFVETKAYTFDLDQDEVIDLTQRGVGLVLTDRDDLCSLGVPVDEVDDIFAVQMISMQVDGPDLLENNTTLFKTVLNPELGDVFIGVRVIHRVGGETVAQYTTKNLVDPEAIDSAEFWISSQSISNGETRSLAGSFKAQLQVDLSDEDAFDADFDGDGEDDFRAIDVPVKGKVASADPCGTLDLLP